jgi:hypothetical protein
MDMGFMGGLTTLLFIEDARSSYLSVKVSLATVRQRQFGYVFRISNI